MDYLVYRHGSNASNQHMRDTMPIAIVTAESADEAIACERHDPPNRLDVHAPATLVLEPRVEVWANQRLSAVPVQDAPEDDVREVTEAGR